MLTRSNYHQEKRDNIKQLAMDVIDELMEMTVHFKAYLKEPTKETKQFILKNENYVDKNEKKIESYILEIISLQQLDIHEIKWLLTMNRIIRELERVGDQLTNIITFSNVLDAEFLRPKIKPFFEYQREMMQWLKEGITSDQASKLQNVIEHDQHINILNKETYQQFVEKIHEQEKLTESRLKMVIISRFLERIGDHLVNAAKLYKKVVEENE